MVFNIVISVIILLIIIRMFILENVVARTYDSLEKLVDALNMIANASTDDIDFPNSEVKNND